MTDVLRSSLLVVSAASVLVLASCASPPPTCSAAETAYTVCSDEQVWQCPVATAEQLAAKQAITGACQQQPDPTKCILDAKFEMFEMTLKAKCGEGGQVCVESRGPGPQVAQCQIP